MRFLISEIWDGAQQLTLQEPGQEVHFCELASVLVIISGLHNRVASYHHL